MKIIDRLNEDRIHISFEIFPPKTDEGFDSVIAAADEMAKLNPAFISVTYGAGGGTSKNTARIASHIKDELHVLSLAHLTCASSTKEEVRYVIENLKSQGIENILALRGDIPANMTFPDENRFQYAMTSSRKPTLPTTRPSVPSTLIWFSQDGAPAPGQLPPRRLSLHQ